MSTPPVFEPAMYYDVTARDNNEACRNFGETFGVPEFYSNDGVHCYAQCGICRQNMEILTAVLLDPQPVFS